MIVMKFGGTSVQDAAAIDRAAAIVRGRLPEHPVVVVSAMSKVTDTLLAMGRAAGDGDRSAALDLARGLRERRWTSFCAVLPRSARSRPAPVIWLFLSENGSPARS
jgi:aspartate kinase